MQLPIWTQPVAASLAFWVAYAICFVPELVGSFFQKSAPADNRQDRGSQAIIIVGTNLSLCIGFTLALIVPSLRITSNGALMLWLGTGLMAAGVAFRWYAIQVLGRFFTRDVAIRENHEIIRAGPYRLLRHPSYSGYLLAATGIGLALNNSAALLALVGINFAVYNHRIKIEEAALLGAFGAAYAIYQRETKKLIPFIH